MKSTQPLTGFQRSPDPGKSAKLADMEPQQVPLPPAAGFLAPLPAPPLHRWQSGATYDPTVRMAWARDVPIGSASERLVLLTLAAHTDRWAVCWPSLSTLAESTMLDRRTVTRALRSMEGAGVVDRDKPKDRPPCTEASRPPWADSTVYRLGISLMG